MVNANYLIFLLIFVRRRRDVFLGKRVGDGDERVLKKTNLLINLLVPLLNDEHMILSLSRFFFVFFFLPPSPPFNFFKHTCRCKSFSRIFWKFSRRSLIDRSNPDYLITLKPLFPQAKRPSSFLIIPSFPIMPVIVNSRNGRRISWSSLKSYKRTWNWECIGEGRQWILDRKNKIKQLASCI